MAIEIKTAPETAVPISTCGSEKNARVLEAIANPINMKPNI